MHDVWLHGIPDTPIDPDILTRTEALLKYPKCSEFLNGLLGQLGKATGRGREGVSFEDLFAAARGSIFTPNFYARGSASPDGILVGNPAFSIHIMIRGNVPSDTESAPTTIMHEIVHGSPREGANYSHFEMADAAYTVAGPMGILSEHDYAHHNDPNYKPNPGLSDNYNSSLFQDILVQACGRPGKH